jgi:hypothetical protein
MGTGSAAKRRKKPWVGSGDKNKPRRGEREATIMMTGLHYASLLLGTISGIVFAFGVVWYLIHHQPLFLIVQSWVITFNMKFLVLNLCVLMLAVLTYSWVHNMRKY